MDENQFLKQATRVVKRIESRIVQFYEKFLYNNKMTIAALKRALYEARFTDITDQRVIELINIQRTDVQDISVLAFRNIFTMLYTEYLWDICDNDKTLEAIFGSLDPR
ncbi:uncharacterized protein LOC126910170 [Daktulosphaira vitifoliae]|uniref:uncharacterized protein LOC126910170 n=1 Tax=Daktulosphaira vitifoliae TaxID=58002 RepID=UPI0021AABD8B|nr:uncharacterized protein LOC126910170 [Daktulosphaira vitifoliae]